MNRYAYVLGNPLNYTDPDGRDPCPAGAHCETIHVIDTPIVVGGGGGGSGRSPRGGGAERQPNRRGVKKEEKKCQAAARTVQKANPARNWKGPPIPAGALAQQTQYFRSPEYNPAFMQEYNFLKDKVGNGTIEYGSFGMLGPNGNLIFSRPPLVGTRRDEDGISRIRIRRSQIPPGALFLFHYHPNQTNSYRPGPGDGPATGSEALNMPVWIGSESGVTLVPYLGGSGDPNGFYYWSNKYQDAEKTLQNCP